jgi:hypothetical protein
MNKLLILALSASIGVSATLRAQNNTRAEYIEKFKNIAVEHAEKYGIPASIKMAQGMLESGNGNGKLAREGNTHFNIKVKASDNWQGRIVYHDDDAPNEPFRAYETAEQSWIDHSVYLDSQPRYDSLFRYSVTDYKSWARGLKNAGYATDPLYAEKLIKIIEDNGLWMLDRSGLTATGLNSGTPGTTDASVAGSESPTAEVDVDNFIIAMYYSGGRDLLRTQHGRFIVAKAGDTLRSISRLTGIRVGLLARYNRLEKHTSLSDGQRIKIG